MGLAGSRLQRIYRKTYNSFVIVCQHGVRFENDTGVTVYGPYVSNEDAQYVLDRMVATPWSWGIPDGSKMSIQVTMHISGGNTH